MPTILRRGRYDFALLRERRRRADASTCSSRKARKTPTVRQCSRSKISKLVPGDLVSLYATAKDARAEAHTDIYFIQADPFERDFSQSQSAGGGGGGGGAADQNDISEREKEIIAQTWKQRSDKSAASQQSADTGKFLSEVQSKLRDQAIALAGRLQMRDLNTQNDEFNDFQQDMTAAARRHESGRRSASSSRSGATRCRANRKLCSICCKPKRPSARFRWPSAAAGGGRAAEARGRDLASLFDLELDTQKNQYETAQTASSADEKQKEIDDALKKLDDLARRQQDLANQARNSNQNLPAALAAGNAAPRCRAVAAPDGAARAEQSPAEWPAVRPVLLGQSSSGQSLIRSNRIHRNRSRRARRVPRAPIRATSASSSRSINCARRIRTCSAHSSRATPPKPAARPTGLRDATNLLGSMQQQQASGHLDSMASEADRLAAEQRDQADRMRKLLSDAASANQSGQGSQDLWNQASALARDRQQLADDLANLEKQARDAERELNSTQHGAASKLRDALGNLDQEDLQTRLQRSADWLQRGIGPNSLSTESGISADLQRFSDQLRQAQQALGAGQQQPQGQDSQAAIDRLEQLRNQMAGITRDMGRPGDAAAPEAAKDRTAKMASTRRMANRASRAEAQASKAEGLAAAATLRRMAARAAVPEPMVPREAKSATITPEAYIERKSRRCAERHQ